MKKTKLLAALLLCTAVALPIKAYSAEQIFDEGTYQGVSQPTQNGGAIFNNTGDTAIVKAGTQFINNEAKRGAGIYNYVGGNLTIEDGVKFDNNRAVGAAGGAIQNFGTAVMGDNLIFENNTAKWGGAAIYAGSNSNGGHSTTIGSGAIFRNNTLTDSASYGGAIFVEDDNNSENVIFTLGNNSTFENNSAMEGGSIYLKQGTIAATIGEGATFNNNTATETGGAIFTRTDLSLNGATFSNNTATRVDGGAIYNEGATLNIANSSFVGNKAGDWGGAIINGKGGNANITDSVFENNMATTGGAIGSYRSSNETNVANSVFKANEAVTEAGALWLGNKSTVSNSLFDSNKTTGTIYGNNDYNTDNEGGGAIFVGSNSKTTIESSTFTNNQSGTVGGAIATRSNAQNDGSSSLNITSSTFDGNKATVNGGAVASFIDSTITDTNFTNNTAGSKGGAVWTNQNLTVNAVNSDIVMAGNKASDGADIFMNKEGSNLNLNAQEGRSITVASGISGNENGYNMLVNSNGGTGSLIVNSAIQNAAIDVQNGTFQLGQNAVLVDSDLTMATGSTFNSINGRIDSADNIARGDSSVTFADGTNIAADVNISNGTADNFVGADIQGKVILTDIKALGNTTANNVSINLAEALGIDPNKLAISEALQNQTQRVLTPIRYLQGGISETGMLIMAPTGNSYKDFNPAVMASPVAAQLGGYLTQLNSYDQAFRNMDMYMLMTRKQREAMKLRNKYAAADSNLVFDPTGSAYDDKAVWVRPYATFENVPLKNGPRVSNVAYGSFFGADSELYDLGHGWDGMLSVYAGYNGSHQAYDGIGIYQNGGTLGITGMAYKGNFFTGLTLNAGANVGEANTAYGNDNFTMLMAGIANKTGYNIELADGKFIIQPNVQLSYSFVNTFDYRNAAGVKINSDPLNAIQVEPGIKFIGNLKNGWQPYAGVSVVWNIMDKTNFHANNVSLPELSVKPYVRYGVGVRKTWGEVCTGFLQTYFTNGGRNGVGIQGGFRFTLGKGGLASIKTSNSMPELPKTQINLSSAR